MTVAKIAIRSVRIEDATAIAAIYAHHVLNGTASFDTVPRTVAETAERVGWITGQGWPFIVAEADGDVLGYAYATQFRDRPAYAATCENSIYLHPDWIGRGVGRMLLTELIDRARVAEPGNAAIIDISRPPRKTGICTCRTNEIRWPKVRTLARYGLHAIAVGWRVVIKPS